MSVASRVASAFDDRLNPIVVKEIRQAVHGRFLAGLLLFFLIFQLATLGLFLLSNGITTIDIVGGASYGEQVFGILFGILSFATVVCVPIYAAIRIHGERSGQSMALFFISTLSPRRIITGKLASNLAITLLIQSACLPYLSFTYFLRGIDLPTVFVALVVNLLVSALAIQAAIFCAALRATRVLKVLIGLAGLGWLIALFSMVLVYAIALPMQGVGSRLVTWEFWGPAAFMLTLGGLLFGLLFFLSVAMITHRVANRARPVRIYAFSAWLAAGLATGYDCLARGQTDTVQVWLLLAFGLFGLSFLLAVSAPDRMSLRVGREVPDGRLTRFLAFFTFSGSANGVAFSVVMVALTVGVAEIFNRGPGGSLGETPDQLLGFCAYCLSYSLFALLLQRRVISRWIRPSQTWVVALVLAAFFSLVPPIAGFLLASATVSRALDFGMLLIANPFAPFQHPFGVLATRFGLGWSAVMALLVAGWFRQQVHDFRPPIMASEATLEPAVSSELQT